MNAQHEKESLQELVDIINEAREEQKKQAGRDRYTHHLVVTFNFRGTTYCIPLPPNTELTPNNVLERMNKLLFDLEGNVYIAQYENGSVVVNKKE